MSPEVAIIGVGLHPFGRYGGKSALRDGGGRGRTRRSPMPASGGRTCRRSTPAAWRSRTRRRSSGCSGETGIPGRAVFNGCATGGAPRWPRRRTRSVSARPTSPSRSAWTSTRGAPSPLTRQSSGLPLWYGEAGLFLTTHFFGMKINRYMHDYGISTETLAQGGGEGLPQRRARTRGRWRRKPMTRGGDPRLARCLNYPLTQYMYCAPNEGGRGGRAVPRRSGPPVHQYADLPAGQHAAQPP